MHVGPYTKARRSIVFLSMAVLFPALTQAATNGVFQRLDRNDDGKVTREEAGGARWFKRLDRDGNGAITLEEVRARRSSAAGVGAAVPRHYACGCGLWRIPRTVP